MDINYHYYTIKTLAHFAGFDDNLSEMIAHFSQFIDDFKLSSPLIVDEKPPEYFFEHRLAFPYGDKWLMIPCATGVNPLFLHTFFQEFTLFPFHYINPEPRFARHYHNRIDLRCQSADQDYSFFINRKIKETLIKTRLEKKEDVIRLAMLLHVYADTYAHDKFSAFIGWENDAKLVEMKHHTVPKNFLSKLLKSKKLIPLDYDFSSVPPLGHNKVGKAPDYCDCSIKLEMQADDRLRPEILIDRNNTEFFGVCSKNIFKMFCRLVNRPYPGDEAFNKIQARLARAQNCRLPYEWAYKLSWKKEFKEINYRYNKEDYIKLSFSKEVIPTRFKIESKVQLSEEQLKELSIKKVKEVNNLFYTFNQITYDYVYSVLTSYQSDFTKNYVRMILDEKRRRGMES